MQDGDMEEPAHRRFIGRISRTESSDARRPRISLEIDAVELEDYQRGDFKNLRDAPEKFAIVRLTSTPRRVAEVLNAEESQLTEGAWLQLVITPKRAGSLVVKMAELDTGGYETLSSASLWDGDFLYSDNPLELRPFPAGATVREPLREAGFLAEDCQLPPAARKSQEDIAAILDLLPQPNHVDVYDVGQANFIALSDETSNPLLYFDTGWPLLFNKRTAPAYFLPRSVKVIILSHWDFDHLLGFYKFKHLQNAIWIVPEQRLGPGARRIAELLFRQGNLVIFSDDRVRCSWGQIGRCSGAIGNANDTGLSLQVTLQSGRDVLLVGDASYQYVPLLPSCKPHFLVATHHGAQFEGEVPAPFQGPLSNYFPLQVTCVVSVGNGNVYGHPKPDAIRAHRSAGWQVTYTSHEGNLGSRGSRKLGP